jgi:hypothetical protein
VRMMVE